VPRRTSPVSRIISAHAVQPQLGECAQLFSIQNLVLFPKVGRAQTVAGVRKLVTGKYPYVVYYTVDEKSEEVIVLTIQHPARERNYEDA
jgi:toxin ParE1/3/4